jgi:hypothetical protein
MNPHGLLIAYAEDLVKPVVSDFDAFLVGSTGMAYSPVPPDQVEVAVWSLERTQEILANPDDNSWTGRWLDILHDLAEQGEHHDFPPYGYGDATTVFIVKESTRALSESGGIRHGAECFNYHFPQELDDEFMIVWDQFDDEPFRYQKENDLREFLLCRAKEGYSFPINPVWPVRDKGWYNVFEVLRASSSAQAALACWFPDKGMFAKIDDLHARYPDGFVIMPSQNGRNSEHCADKREKAELIMHSAVKKAKAKQQGKESVSTKMHHAFDAVAHSLSGHLHHSHSANKKDGGKPQDASGAVQKKPSFLKKVKSKFSSSS